MQQGIAFSDQIQQEDIVLCEQVQRGLRSRAYDTGRFSAKRENGVYHFQHLVREFMGEPDMNAAPRADGRLTVALVSEVFWQPDGIGRLGETLDQCVERGADLAVLPEIPLNPWRPATKVPNDEDAEPMDGPRASAMAAAARAAGIGLVEVIIHRDPASGRRTSRVLVFDRSGSLA